MRGHTATTAPLLRMASRTGVERGTPVLPNARRLAGGWPVTLRDRFLLCRPWGRGTGRGTSTGHMPVDWVLPERLRVLSVQAERPLRRSGPLLIRGFGVRVPGGAPVLTCGFSRSKVILADSAWNDLIRCFDANDAHTAQFVHTYSYVRGLIAEHAGARRATVPGRTAWGSVRRQYESRAAVGRSGTLTDSERKGPRIGRKLPNPLGSPASGCSTRCGSSWSRRRP